jgi:hypothetical protein
MFFTKYKDTLSKTDVKSINTLDRLPIATLKSTQHGIQSCKMLCFSTPFCKSYEYLMYDDSCNLYSSSKVESYYKSLIDKYKSSSSDFNLIHLLQENLMSVLQESSTFNNTLLVDKKLYPECEPKTNVFFLTEELHCSDELADFADTYVLENLVPTTKYQFRVEVANAFGKSDSFLTKEIESKNKMIYYHRANIFFIGFIRSRFRSLEKNFQYEIIYQDLQNLVFRKILKCKNEFIF